MTTWRILPILAGVALMLAGACAPASSVHAQAGNTTGERLSETQQQQVPVAPTGTGADYVLGVGDKLRITVFGEPDLSGNFEVSSTGSISMPLIGDVVTAQRTVSQIQADITQKLSNGYMRSPHVSLEVMNYRPFFIIGEVMKPGSYNYVNGMTVINAIALAGGYTYRADKDGTTVKHANNGNQAASEQKANEYMAVSPGDVITVPERFF